MTETCEKRGDNVVVHQLLCPLIVTDVPKNDQCVLENDGIEGVEVVDDVEQGFSLAL